MGFISYFITDPSYSLQKLKKAVQIHKPTFVCYRNKNYFDENEIIEFASFSVKYSKVFINYDSLKDENLLKYFDGVHLPSTKLNLIDSLKEKNKLVIASTHSIEEVNHAKKADYITYSPIFDSKGRKGLGVEVINKISHNVIALGGIVSYREIELVKDTKAVGFASIRFFLNNLS